MSWRGRVIRRQNVACYLKPQSIQEQMEQYDYLGRALRIPQYEAKYWRSPGSWLSEMMDTGRVVSVSSVFPSWTGVDGDCIKVPIGTVFVLDLFWRNIGGTHFNQGERSGFLYKLSSGEWVDTTSPWVLTGDAQEDTVCHVSVVSTPLRPTATIVLGADNGFQVGDWQQTGGHVVECYYVCPMFDTGTHGNPPAPMSVVMIEPKVY